MPSDAASAAHSSRYGVGGPTETMRAPSSSGRRADQRSLSSCDVSTVPTTRIVERSPPAFDSAEIARRRRDKRRVTRCGSMRSTNSSSSPRENSESTAMRARHAIAFAAKRSEIIARIRARMRLHPQPRDVVHRDHDRHRADAAASFRRRSAAYRCARGARALRQQHLVPIDAPVEAPWIETWFGQARRVDALAPGQRVGQTAERTRRYRWRSDRELRVERNPHLREEIAPSARTISAFGSRRARACRNARRAVAHVAAFEMRRRPVRRSRRRCRDSIAAACANSARARSKSPSSTA